MKRLAVTLGDPNGVGPEIVARAFAAGELGDDVVVYGDAAVVARCRDHLGLGFAVGDGRRSLPMVDLGVLAPGSERPGKIDAAAGAAARAYVVAATRAALAGEVAAVVTLPINKEATRLLDPGFVGHTELVAALCGVTRYTMMLASDRCVATHVSTHVPLAEAIGLVTPERVLDVIRLTHGALRRFIEAPRVAVAGLNPHAGEHGLFGHDEGRIAPAIAAARAEGIDAQGPVPPDTVFYQAAVRGRFDGVVCMYHDQGHIPMKVLDFEGSVNVTLGLPIVRTSVDHGTAYDIAWQGKASTRSLAAALAFARKLSGG